MYRKLVKDKKRILAVVIMTACVLLAVTVYASTGFKQVKILIDNEPVIYAYTSKTTVSDLLDEFGINVSEDDVITRETNADLVDDDIIDIKTAKKINIFDADEQYEIYSTYVTVGELIENGIIELDETLDYMNVTKEDKLFDGIPIRITRVTKETVEEESEILFQTREVKTTSLPEGEKAVTQQGVNGVGIDTIVVTYENGKEVSREKIGTKVIKSPVECIIEVGVESGRPKIYKKVISCNATAYCACAKCCGKSTGITASGMRATYGCVAVDPRVIPLGTKLYIETPDGGFIYGESIAADTGGAIKGNKVDLFFPSHSQALQFGRRRVNVYVL